MSDWKWQILQAGAFRLDGGAMFGVIPKALWGRMTTPDDANRISLQTNCLLLERGDRKVLVETGYGNKFGEKDRRNFAMQDRWISDALDEVGVRREDITDVVLTHLHFDHAGGLTYVEGDDPTPRSSFPNATIYTQRLEWEDALSNKSTMTKTYLENHLTPIQQQVQFLEGEAEVMTGIWVRPVPGHTWGQQAVLFEDDKGTVCFPGDMMPTFHNVGSAFNMAYDMLPYQNTLTKAEVLGRARDQNWRIVIDHEPEQALVSVTEDHRGRFALESLKED